MSRYFRLNSDHHACASWSLSKGDVTPPVDEKTAGQILQFPEDFWTEVYKCPGGCKNLVENENELCSGCAVDIDLPVRDLLPQLRKLRGDATDWDKVCRKLIAQEENGDNRDTILSFLQDT